MSAAVRADRGLFVFKFFDTSLLQVFQQPATGSAPRFMLKFPWKSKAKAGFLTFSWRRFVS